MLFVRYNMKYSKPFYIRSIFDGDYGLFLFRDNEPLYLIRDNSFLKLMIFGRLIYSYYNNGPFRLAALHSLKEVIL